MEQEVKDLFARYDKANNASNFSEFGGLYADRFLFGGPDGVHIVEREGFLKVLPKMKAHLASMGLLEGRVQTVEVYPLDTRYVLAKVGWQMTLCRVSGNVQVDAFTTFVLSRGAKDALSIVFQIDHQDLTATIENQQPGE